MSIFWKVGNIIKIDKYWTFLPYVFFSSAVSMVIERPDFSENEYLNLKLYISTSVCQTFLRNFFWNYRCLMYKILLIFSKLFPEVFLLPWKVYWGQHVKNCTSNYSWCYRWTEQNFENLRHPFVTTFLLFQTNLWWLSRCKTSLQSGYKRFL